MLRNATVAVLALLASPAQAEWFGMISEHGDIRQATLRGMAESDPLQQISFLCTVPPDLSPAHAIIAALPATGEYVVRQGDIVSASITMNGKTWALEMPVDTNSSSSFVASADSPAAAEIVAILETAPAEMQVEITAGPISRTFTIDMDGLGRRATEWLDGCGR